MDRKNNTETIKNLDAQLSAILKDHITKVLAELADKLLEYAQSRHKFKNQTFNLEDSFGYAIYYNGNMLKKTLSSPKATTSKKYNGQDWRGRDAANKLLDEYKAPDGYSLVVVAGMFYAEWVERIHNLDVLSGSYNLAQSEVESLFKSIPVTVNYKA